MIVHRAPRPESRAAAFLLGAAVGHRLDCRQRESSINRLLKPESKLLRCPQVEGNARAFALFSSFLSRTRKSRTGWRRGGDSNPRDPFESTRVPGVRLKPGSATSPGETRLCITAPRGATCATWLAELESTLRLRTVESWSLRDFDRLPGANRVRHVPQHLIERKIHPAGAGVRKSRPA
jgi:hypothetical protein